MFIESQPWKKLNLGGALAVGRVKGSRSGCNGCGRRRRRHRRLSRRLGLVVVGKIIQYRTTISFHETRFPC